MDNETDAIESTAAVLFDSRSHPLLKYLSETRAIAARGIISVPSCFIACLAVLKGYTADDISKILKALPFPVIPSLSIG